MTVHINFEKTNFRHKEIIFKLFDTPMLKKAGFITVYEYITEESYFKN